MKFRIDRENKVLVPINDKAKKIFNYIENYITLKIVTSHERRSIEQNKLWWAYYGEIAGFMKVDIEYAHCFCKYHIGIPILKASERDLIKKYEMLESKYNYEELLDVLEIVPVTRLFTINEGVKYTEELQRYWAEKGLIL